MSFNTINKAINDTVGGYFAAFGLQTPELKPLAPSQQKTAPADPDSAISMKPATRPNSASPSDSSSQEASPVAKAGTEKPATPATHPSTHGKPQSFTASHRHPPTALNKLQQNKGGTSVYDPAWLDKYMASQRSKTPKSDSQPASKHFAKTAPAATAAAKIGSVKTPSLVMRKPTANSVSFSSVKPRGDTHTDIRLLTMAHQRHTAENARFSKNSPVVKLNRAPKNEAQVASLLKLVPEKTSVSKRLDPSRLPKPGKSVPGDKGPAPLDVAHADKPHGVKPMKVSSHRNFKI